ncbi:MAG: AcrR family transcriptional regulator [Flavobacteriales bacterium]|jgi:AcrR family transcriptional regulator
MNRFQNKITLNICEMVFIKDPNSSELGRNIVKGSIDLIDELGFEDFTFKKLSKGISSTEASIYRYFESKHHLLSYLILWYWGWQEYRMILSITNIDDSKEQLKRVVKILTEEIKEDSNFAEINEVKLNRIVIAEASKIYLNKKVDHDNSLGFFKKYKEVVQMVSEIIISINSTYKYPHMLVSTIIEGAHHQRYFAQHLPSLTDVVDNEDSITTFYQKLALKEIQ